MPTHVPHRSLLGLFARHPAPGLVKTRLAAALSPDAAAALYSAFTQDIVARFRHVAARRILAFTPSDIAAREHFHQLAAGDYELWPQPDGSLGERLHAFFDAHLAAADRSVVIGSDSPTLPAEFAARALELLGERDCVLGPAADGGYYLIALRRPSPALFEGIEWGTPRVLEQTVDRLRQAGLSLHLLPVWYDVDTPDDLAFLRGDLAAMRHAGLPVEVPATDQALREIAGRGRV
jgi:rSAM/selenodomain-associated transferase 1